jgi:hypothetical protein
MRWVEKDVLEGVREKLLLECYVRSLSAAASGVVMREVRRPLEAQIDSACNVVLGGARNEMG